MSKSASEPIVFPSYPFRRAIYQLLSFSTPNGSGFKLPPWLKYFLLTLIIANIKSFPLLWHIRVFSSAIRARSKSRPSIHALLPWIRSNKYITTSPGVSPRLRLDTIPIGRDIFTDSDIVQLRALPDDCDWNMHMSNSAYAKVLDYCRISFLSERFLRAHFDGSHFALGGATYTFHAEIPLLAKFEVETSIASWDHKWLYVVARFTSPTNRKREMEQAQLSNSKLSKSAQNLRALLADVTKPNQEAGAAAAKAIYERQSKPPAETKLYCTCISWYCFKGGRKTIPPWLAVATSGYGTFASTRTNWDKAENLRRNVQAKRKADYLERRGKPMPRDHLFLGSAFRKAGIFSAYDPGRPEDAKDDERGLGAYQDKSSWQLAEWEERRLKRLEIIRNLGAVAVRDATAEAAKLSE